mmetsp:Transcript_34893/g.86792  ORF Transcript_34893/g.86792 Transcript_34893/m.86792 type:complete len:337 (+) Transcript_34893:627-1637(+)
MKTETPSSSFAGGWRKPMRITDELDPCATRMSKPSWSTPSSSTLLTFASSSPAYTAAKRLRDSACAPFILWSSVAAAGASGLEAASAYSAGGTHASTRRTASLTCTRLGVRRRHGRAPISSAVWPVAALIFARTASETSSTLISSTSPIKVTAEPAAAPPDAARTKKLATRRAFRLLFACSDDRLIRTCPAASVAYASQLEKMAPSSSAASSVVHSVPCEQTSTTVRVSCASVSRSALSARSPQGSADGAAAAAATQRGGAMRVAGRGLCCSASRGAAARRESHADARKEEREERGIVERWRARGGKGDAAGGEEIGEAEEGIDEGKERGWMEADR